MENAPIKLNKLVEEFHYFEDNQVLTATQLNTVVDYLDRRDRLTRVKLIGVGVVCGLDITIDSDRSSIQLSKGVAITSDGDLLHLEQTTTYSLFRAFDDSKAKYPPFLQYKGETQIPLFRLYADEESNPPELSPLSSFGQEGVNLGEMAVVLYMNSYLEPPEECTAVDCENLGTKQKNELVPLLINRGDLDRMNKKGSNPFFDLSEAFVERVDFHDNVITHEEELLGRYRSAIVSSSPDLITAVTAACGRNQGDFLNNLLQDLYNDSLAVGARWRTDLTEQFSFGNADIRNRPDVLHAYNYMKDLAQAYNEFRSALFDLLVDCCPSPDLHPKHVMVGELENVVFFLPKTYRHHFCESPVLNHKDKRITELKVLHKRLDSMISSFAAPNNNELPIKITPSKYGDYKLGEKSIPYYYQNNPRSVNTFWNFAKTIRNQAKSIPGYHADRYDGTLQAQNPLGYSIDQYNFFRIEGHLGKPKNVVEDELERIKKVRNLNFNVVTVQIQDEIRTIIPRRPIRFPAVDVLLHDYSFRYKADLSLVHNFNDRLKVVTPETVSDKSADYIAMETSLRTAQDEAVTLNAEISSIRNHLQTNVATLADNYPNFKASFNKIVNTSHTINERIYPFTQTRFEVPLQKFVLENQVNRFDSLVKYFNEKRRKVKQQYIFDKFYNQNTGMEHLSGVHEGGTFVLVYTTAENESDQRVVADFCISGCCVVEIDPEVTIEEVEVKPIPVPPTFPIPPLRPLPFIDNVSVYKFPIIKTTIDTAVTTVDGVMGRYLGEVNVLKGGLQDLITRNDSIKTIFTPGDLERSPYEPIDIQWGIRNTPNYVAGDIFTDATKGSLANTLTTAARNIRELENKETLTDDDRERLTYYSGVFDETSAKILIDTGNQGTDISAFSDELRLLGVIQEERATFKGVQLNKTNEFVANKGQSFGDRPLLQGMLNRF